MTEQEMALVEQQQACRRVACPHCSGTGKVVVSDHRLSGERQRDIFGSPVFEQRGGFQSGPSPELGYSG